MAPFERQTLTRTAHTTTPPPAADAAPRPLSPGGEELLRSALRTAADAIAALDRGAASCAAAERELAGAGEPDTLAARGRARSLQDACATLRAHTAALVDEAADAAGARDGPTAADAAVTAAALRVELLAVGDRLEAGSGALDAHFDAAEPSALKFAPPGARLAELTATGALDGAARTACTLLSALAQRGRREGAAVAARFLGGGVGGGVGGLGGDPVVVAAAADGTAAAPPALLDQQQQQQRVLKVGAAAMKRLKNGDVFEGTYARGRKNGAGAYSFANGDAYEGGFLDDRMHGWGVYRFHPEGGYAGAWAAAAYAGAGFEAFAAGASYRGRYAGAGGLRHGAGACRFRGGDFCEGAWAGGAREGLGMQQCADGSNYAGEYSGGRRAGRGVYSFPNGDAYAGDYADDLPQCAAAAAAPPLPPSPPPLLLLRLMLPKGGAAALGVLLAAAAERSTRPLLCPVVQYNSTARSDTPLFPLVASSAAPPFHSGWGVYSFFAGGQRYEGRWERGRKHGWSVYTVGGQRWAGSWDAGKVAWVAPLPPPEQEQQQGQQVEQHEPAAAADGSAGATEQQPPPGLDAAANIALAVAARAAAQEVRACVRTSVLLGFGRRSRDSSAAFIPTCSRERRTHSPYLSPAHNNPTPTMRTKAARAGAAKALEHWRPGGAAQAALRAALAEADAAAAAAYTARAEARGLARRLHAAALLVEADARTGGGVRLAAGDGDDGGC